MFLFLSVPLHDENDEKKVINSLSNSMYIPMLGVTAGGARAPVPPPPPAESAPVFILFIQNRDISILNRDISIKNGDISIY